MSQLTESFEAARQSFLAGLEALQAGRFVEAEECLSHSLRLMPDRVSTLTNLAAVQVQLKRFQQARDTARRSVQVDPNNARGWMNLGIALAHLNQVDTALEAYDQALRIAPDLAEAWTNRGSAVSGLGRHTDALSQHDAAIRLDPGLALAWFNKGTSLADLGRYAESLAAYDEAIQLSPHYGDAHLNKADALEHLGRYEDALSSIDDALAADPGADVLPGRRLHLRMKLCEWSAVDTGLSHCIEGIRASRRVIEPFDLLGLVDDPRLQLECARISIRSKTAHAEARTFSPQVSGNKIRVAYVSPDFRLHPVSRLVVEMVESHDRNKFELIAVNFGARSTDPLSQRILAGFDTVIDAQLLNDQEVVETLASLRVEIAVDLAGHTDGSRTGVFERRCAPIQVNYLGFPGTSGSSQIDYIIGDRIVIPDSSARDFSEMPVLLPGCFQANDSHRPQPVGPISRAGYGLPPDSVVLCAFSNSYKLVPQMADQWAKVLLAAPQAVLWLLAESEAVRRNLTREFISRGVGADRLFFAGRERYEDYLNRYRLADLLLDTYPFNGGTTVSDALWMGLPVLTLAGRSFASRMAASLLAGVGLEALATHSFDAYSALATQLALDPQRLRAIRTKLEENRASFSVFDGKRVAQHMEAAYSEMARRSRARLPPAPIDLSA